MSAHLHDIAATIVGLLITLPSAYLAFLAAVSLLPRRARPRVGTSADRETFAILVPAHDEERVIARTLASLAGLEYPRDRFSVHVVADNCSDDTAAIARDRGTCVHERTDPHRPGKGAALNWLVDEVLAEHRHVDAFVIVAVICGAGPSWRRRSISSKSWTTVPSSASVSSLSSLVATFGRWRTSVSAVRAGSLETGCASTPRFAAGTAGASLRWSRTPSCFCGLSAAATGSS